MSLTAEQALEQRRNALERANEVTAVRVELKRRIARGEIRVAEIILDPPAEVGNWTVYGVLTAQRNWGRGRAVHLLTFVGVPEAKTLRWLTVRQRKMIAKALGDPA